MRSLLPILVLACAVSDPAAPSAADPAPPPLVVVAPPAVLEGTTLNLEVQGARANRPVDLLSSTAMGAPACPPPLMGGCLPLASPVLRLGRAQADGSGVAQLALPVPGGTAGIFAELAAVQLGGSALISGAVPLAILSASGDEDGDRLTNEAELTVHLTDPLLADSDGGGTGDWEEVVLQNTDPNDPSDDDVTWACDGAPTGTTPGFCAPDFHLLGDDGTMHRLSDYRGYVVLLDFSTMWCIHCQNLAEDIPTWEADYGADGFTPITVLWENLNYQDPSLQDLQTWVDAYPADHPVLAGDDAVWQSFGAGGRPLMFVIDRDGRITWRFNGYPGMPVVTPQIAAQVY